MSNTKILFVEDTRRLIEPLVELVRSEHPEWELYFAYDIPSAWEELTREAFDCLVIDVMLPSWPTVPQRSEGIYLADWATTDEIADIPLRGKRVKAYTLDGIIFYTSRTVDTVSHEVRDKIDGQEVKIAGRLACGPHDVLRMIEDVVGKGRTLEERGH